MPKACTTYTVMSYVKAGAYGRISRGSNHASIQVMLLRQNLQSTLYSAHCHACSVHIHVLARMLLLEVNKYSAHIYFWLFSAWSCLAENLLRPKFCFARFNVTVYTGGSSTGRKFDAAEMGFSPGRTKFEWAENLTYSIQIALLCHGALQKIGFYSSHAFIRDTTVLVRFRST